MIRDTEEKDEFPITNPEDNTTIFNNKAANSSNCRLWSGLQDSRIVRVSRAFGGKDRHSKVSTIRGLRDRRVRLSVPTAIQLYDLQDRLGLNQPSKVVDWLLNAAQHEINKLPPLGFIPVENLIQLRQSSDQASKDKNNNHDLRFHVEEEHQLEIGSAAFMHQDAGIYNAQSPFYQDNLPYNNSRGGGDHALGLIGNGGFPYASYYHWDQSSRNYLSQLGIISSQADVASASVLSSSYTSTTVPCELDAQNLPLNSSTIFRNSFHSGGPKAS